MLPSWQARAVDETVAAQLEQAGKSRLFSRLLAARGVTAATAEAYLNPAFADLPPPDTLPGVAAAVEVILAAVAAGREIVIFGDYDCDGVAATAILYKALHALGARRLAAFIPERLTEGFGMTPDSVARLKAEHPEVGLVVTVDNGVNAVAEVAKLQREGIEVVVTDHHLPGEELPVATALVNPKVAADAAGRYADLCGAGVAYLLAWALIMRARELQGAAVAHGGLSGELFTLAALATVSDVMPLVGVNRSLVALALRNFQKWAPLGLKELWPGARRGASETLSAHDFGFQLSPRINSAGRIGSAMPALRLLLAGELSVSAAAARELAQAEARQIEQLCAERKTIEGRMFAAAMAQLRKGAAAQVLEIPDGHQGVSGIVASRVMEQLGEPVPVAVVVERRGSARAPEGGINVRSALEACSEALERFGGHAAAAGFSVREGQLERFRELFASACARQGAAAAPRRWYDLEVRPEELTEAFVGSLAQLAPFGLRNEEPVFLLKGLRCQDLRVIGASGDHLAVRFAGEGNASPLRAVWWKHSGDLERLRAAAATPVDVLVTAVLSDYGCRHVELRIQAMSLGFRV